MCREPSPLAVAPMASSSSPSWRVAWLTEHFLHLLEIPVHEPRDQDSHVAVPVQQDQTRAPEHAINVPVVEIAVGDIIDAASAALPVTATSLWDNTEERSDRVSPDATGYEGIIGHSGSPRCVNVVMSVWHALVLVVCGTGCCHGAVVVFSHITGEIVQVFRCCQVPSLPCLGCICRQSNRCYCSDFFFERAFLV